MNSEELLAEIKAKFDEFLQARTPRLWTVEDVAAYYQLSRRTVEQKIVSSPRFPRAVMPTGPNAHRRWVPEEVIEYALASR